jgi:hypothetical protein
MISARHGSSEQAALSMSAKSGEERETPCLWASNTAMSHLAEKASKARFKSSQDAEKERMRSALSDALKDIAETTANLDLRRGMMASSRVGDKETQSTHKAVPLGMPSQRRRVGTRRTSNASCNGVGTCSESVHVATYFTRAASKRVSLSGCDATSNSPGHLGADKSPGAAFNFIFFADCSSRGAIAAAMERPTAPGENPTPREETGESK